MIVWKQQEKKMKCVGIRVIFITVQEDKAFTGFEIDE